MTYIITNISHISTQLGKYLGGERSPEVNRFCDSDKNCVVIAVNWHQVSLESGQNLSY